MLIALFSGFLKINSGIVGYGICQSGCNCLAVACYTAAGFTFGTVTAGAGVPLVIIGCNTGLGTCMGACVVAGVLSGPV
jgi:ribose 5-phosphate isomerase RpiB